MRYHDNQQYLSMLE